MLFGQIFAWLSCGHWFAPGARNPLKSSVTGFSFLVNCYLEIKFNKQIRENPPLIKKQTGVGWALLAVKIEISINRLETFHKVGPGRGEHDGEKSFRIGSLICPAVRARSYA